MAEVAEGMGWGSLRALPVVGSKGMEYMPSGRFWGSMKAWGPLARKRARKRRVFVVMPVEEIGGVLE